MDAPHFHQVGSGSEYRLEIPNAKLDYTGTYTVTATNEHGRARAIISLQIAVRDPLAVSVRGPVNYGKVQTHPIVLKGLENLRCCDGDTVTLECVVDDKANADVRWEKGGKVSTKNLQTNQVFYNSFDNNLSVNFGL